MKNLKGNILFFIIIFISINVFSQKKFKVKTEEKYETKNQYYLVDEKENILQKLDTSKYYIFLEENSLKYFAVFGIKGENGWSAIDSNENILFQVYNSVNGEPSPDSLIENKIRIINENNKIGFANEKGEIIINHQFEIVTSFRKNRAIFGNKCKKVYWKKEKHENGCNHYSIECSEHGYINEKGKILISGNYTFEEIMKELNWKNE
ncbi:hypothetical protein SAMN05216503_1490 [Polaribacter sp. KT25b]|uniref:WG repeat-containing protein n=1 Tax=Polaribacter sp. KT25b TaxID=1855336 RepID=UPI00087DE1DE|nr:WG repeat-containing protein [Polaribacter sp. KT25b]SDR95005.1 hypothetical protein SAMN05216503_1490 [Polaribacter sp. KT25b]